MTAVTVVRRAVTLAVTGGRGPAYVPDYVGTSSTSAAIGTGSQSFTTQTDKDFAAGQQITVASVANVGNNMLGRITSYNRATGALVVLVSSVGGSGTFADWAIALAPTPLVVDTDGTLAANSDSRISSQKAVKTYVAAATASIGLTPEKFGALGDGSTDDSAAFAALGDAITAAGGGVIEFGQHKIYRVGSQTLANDGTYMFKPAKLLEIIGCTLPVVIRGNGAKIKFRDGLKFGTFNSSGTVTTHTLPYTTPGEICTPCTVAIIAITNCTGPVILEGACEMDGNAANMVYGGPYGDVGYQLGGDALFLSGNSNTVTMGPWVAHHFPRDGMIFLAPCADETVAKSGSTFIGLNFHNNARNNLSLTQGRGLTFIGSRFTGAGKGTPIWSPPAANVDIEAETGLIRDVAFINCDFVDANAASLVADSGDTKGVSFERCRFIGTTGPACYPHKPGMVFTDCLFVGLVSPLYYSADPTLAVKFIRCEFSDATALSPTGTVYGTYLVDGGGGNQNVLFEGCKVTTATKQGVYLDGGVALWRNSNLTDGSGGGSIFGVRIEGDHNTVTGTISTVGAVYAGRLNLNSVDMTLVSVTYDPPSLAAGGYQYATISTSGLPIVTGYNVDVTFSQSLLGLMINGYYNGAGLIVVNFYNPTGAAVDLPSGTLKARFKSLDL